MLEVCPDMDRLAFARVPPAQEFDNQSGGVSNYDLEGDSTRASPFFGVIDISRTGYQGCRPWSGSASFWELGGSQKVQLLIRASAIRAASPDSPRGSGHGKGGSWHLCLSQHNKSSGLVHRSCRLRIKAHQVRGVEQRHDGVDLAVARFITRDPHRGRGWNHFQILN